MKSLKNFLIALKNLFPFLMRKPNTELSASLGDIRQYQGDVIVNAANSHLMAGGGVCGAIFAAAGHEKLQDACDLLGGCPTGSAKSTPAFDLPFKAIIHAVGPIYTEGQDNAALLGSAYWSSLEEAVKLGAKSIAFPAISTGIYGYPIEDATVIAVNTARAFRETHPGALDAIDFVCFSQKDLDIYTQVIDNSIGTCTAPSIS